MRITKSTLSTLNKLQKTCEQCNFYAHFDTWGGISIESHKGEFLARIYQNKPINDYFKLAFKVYDDSSEFTFNQAINKIIRMMDLADPPFFADE